MPGSWLNVSSISEIDSLCDLLIERDVKLVIIDNLGTVSAGIDENSSAMIAVMSNLRRLAEATGAAVVVTHHQRKTNGVKGQAGDSLRGHSSILAALDLALLIERKDDDDTVSVKSTKTRQVDVLPFAAQFAYEHKPNSSELAEAKFFGLRPAKDDAELALEFAIIACVKKNPGLSQTKLVEAVKSNQPAAPGKHAIREQISEMTAAGKLRVVEAGSGKSSAYYSNDEFIDF
jgi:hypothetical protein